MVINIPIIGEIIREWGLLPTGRDHIEEGLEEMRLYLRNHPSILKESSNYNVTKDFLDLHLANSEKPIIGHSYVPVQITTHSYANTLRLRTSDTVGTLIAIDEINRAYRFNYNNQIVTFPKEERKMGDMTQWGLLYNNTNDAKEFIAMLTLSFGDWDIKTQKVDK